MDENSSSAATATAEADIRELNCVFLTGSGGPMIQAMTAASSRPLDSVPTASALRTQHPGTCPSLPLLPALRGSHRSHTLLRTPQLPGSLPPAPPAWHISDFRLPTGPFLVPHSLPSTYCCPPWVVVSSFLQIRGKPQVSQGQSSFMVNLKLAFPALILQEPLVGSCVRAMLEWAGASF